MDSNICNDRGYHEFRNFDENRQYTMPKQLRNLKCKDCQLKAADYLVAGWVHPTPTEETA